MHAKPSKPDARRPIAEVEDRNCPTWEITGPHVGSNDVALTDLRVV
jgi:hypothetical protein